MDPPVVNAKKRKGSGEPRKAKYMKKILSDDKGTKASSFKKRMPTVMNKSYQLETLCGVSVCVVCFDAGGNIHTWPNDKAEAEARVLGFKAATDKEKREYNVIAMLEDTKRSLVRKMAKEVAACFSELADRSSGERLDAELKRIEEKIGMLKGRDQRVVVATKGRGTDNLSTSCVENGTSCKFEDGFFPDLDNLLVPNGGKLGKMENLGNLAIQDNTITSSPHVVDNYSSMENVTGCSFEDGPFLGLDDIVGPNCIDSVKGKEFGNPDQEWSNNYWSIMIDNSCMEAGTSCTLDDDFFLDLDDVIVDANPNFNDTVKAEDFGIPIQVATNNSLAVGGGYDSSCMKSSTSCSFLDDRIYLDDIVGPNFTGSAGICFAGMGSGGLGFGRFC